MSSSPVGSSEDGAGTAGSAIEAEFDVMAGWTLEAVRALGQDHAIPSACRGSASPASLAWLGEACELRRGSLLLDVGGGVGGPAAYAAERFGVHAVSVDPMREACHAASALFRMPSLIASGDRLPVRTGSVDTVWCLGVVCTMPDKPALFGELRRVLTDGGALGLLVYIAAGPDLSDAPEGNDFPTRSELDQLLEAAHFDVEETAHVGSEVPKSWSERADRVENLIEQRHGSDPRHAQVLEQERRMGRLLEQGQVSGLLLRATAG